jgi:dienelactone hydrolase
MLVHVFSFSMDFSHSVVRPRDLPDYVVSSRPRLDRRGGSSDPSEGVRPMSLVTKAISTLAAAASVACQAGVAPPTHPDHANLMVVRDAKGQERPVRSVDDWQARRGRIVSRLQDVMGPLPGAEKRVPLDLKIEAEFDEPAYSRKLVSFVSEPGDRVPAWLLVPKGGPRRRPAALCLHQTVKIGKDEPVGLGGKPNLRYGRELAERGYVVIAPDYPNFGTYSIDAYARGYQSASMKAVWNNIRAVDVLTSLECVDPSRIAAIGHSLGGHNAIFTAVFEPRITAVVSSCGFNAFPYYYGGNVAGWSHKGYMPRLRDAYQLDLARIPFDFPELIGALAPRPFFTNSPIRDANFAVEGVRVCIASAKPVYALYGASAKLVVVYPDAEHDFPETQRKEAYDFLDRELGWKGDAKEK